MLAELFGLAVVLPIGVIGLFRWGSWLIRKTIGSFYKAEPVGEYDCLVSIITPVYQEDPQTFRLALDSWIANKPHEIVAVIDQEDQLCAQLFSKMARTTPEITLRLIMTSVPGKREALALGVRHARGEVVALVDSDTVWEPDCLPKLTAPFVHPEVGGVSCRQRVHAPATASQKITEMIFEMRYADEMPFLARMDQGFSCLSGRTALYRRDAILPCLEDLVNETFWGRRCISGDDKRLTNLVQAQGYKTRYQGSATVYTVPPRKLATLLKQKVRWTRNSWRSDLRALTQGWVWRKPALALFLLDKCVSTLTALVSPMILGLAIHLHKWELVVAILVWWLVTRGIKLLPYLRRRPYDVWIIPVYVLLGFVQTVIKMYALVTLNQQGWLTRERQSTARVRLTTIMNSTAPYLATLIMVSLLFLGVSVYFVGLG
jgi:hyaluronan synthase